MERANAREREILEKLKALNIDPTKKQEPVHEIQLVQAQSQIEKNTDYVSIMA